MTDSEHQHTQPSYAEHKARIQTRLRRLEGQVRGVQRMIDEDAYCVDVLTQLSAIIAAARGGYFNHLVTDPATAMDILSSPTIAERAS